MSCKNFNTMAEDWFRYGITGIGEYVDAYLSFDFILFPDGSSVFISNDTIIVHTRHYVG